MHGKSRFKHFSVEIVRLLLDRSSMSVVKHRNLIRNCGTPLPKLRISLRLKALSLFPVALIIKR